MKPPTALTLAFALPLIAAFALAADQPRSGYVPKDGFVPTKEVAIRIAVAVWEPIYGAEMIAGEKPYRARLEGEIWIVEGSFNKSPETKGGVALAKIAKADGRIIEVIHGK